MSNSQAPDDPPLVPTGEVCPAPKVGELATPDAVRAVLQGWLQDPRMRAYWIRTAAFHLGRQATARDVEGALETFFRVNLEGITGRLWRTEDDLKAYVFAGLRNFCRSEFWRRLGRKKTDRFDYVRDFREIENRRPRWADQFEVMCAVRDGDTIRAALGEIPTAHRQAFELMSVQALTADEAGPRLGVSPKLASVHNTRAIDRLHTLLRWSQSRLGVPDIPDLSRLCGSLVAARGVQKSVGCRVWHLLTDQVRQLAMRAAGGTALTVDQKGRLLTGLNAALADRSFYDTDHVALPPGAAANTEVRGLLRSDRGPIATLRLNRLLFDAYFLKLVRPAR